MAQQAKEALSVLDLMEAFQLSHAVSALHDMGVLDQLRRPKTSTALARKQGIDGKLLSGLLEYVALRTNLLSKVGNQFTITENYSEQARFFIDLYGGAFGQSASKLSTILRKPESASESVNADLHARAFSQVQATAPRWEAAVVRQLGLNHIVDLGCGPAALLIQLASQDSEFVGWGVEVNPAMSRLARKNVREAGLADSLRVFTGDSRQIRQVLPEKVRRQIRSVAACQVANEMFSSGVSQAVAWLKQIRETLSERVLLLSDYYGRLGSAFENTDRETLLHDYAQLISGQGIPPASLEEWQKIYHKAGCKLVHVLEDQQTTRFLHVVKL
jgi:hypothetical protein